MENEIVKTCHEICQLLVEKNRKYGNSAFKPKRIFSKCTNIEQLLVRIDDKLSRISSSGMQSPDEDTLNDLIGYLILLKIVTEKETTNPEYKHKI
jgi:hypothetical protein